MTQSAHIYQIAGYWAVMYKGRVVMGGESYTVASNVADRLNHPNTWEPTECQEVADVIKASEPTP